MQTEVGHLNEREREGGGGGGGGGGGERESGRGGEREGGGEKRTITSTLLNDCTQILFPHPVWSYCYLLLPPTPPYSS